MDAVTGGLQDKVKMRTKELNPGAGEKPVPTMHESMFWTNFSGVLVAAGLALATGQLVEGWAFCQRHPEVINAIVVYSLASAVGQNFIYYPITQFNPLVLTTVTTSRTSFTTVYSVFRNPTNRLAPMQWGGCGLVFVGMLLDIAQTALCPKKKKDAPKTIEEREAAKAGQAGAGIAMSTISAANEEDEDDELDRFDELDRAHQPLLARGLTSLT